MRLIIAPKGMGTQKKKVQPMISATKNTRVFGFIESFPDF